MTDNNTTHAAQSDKCNGWTNYATWRINLEMWDGFEIEQGEFDDIHSLADYIRVQTTDTIELQASGLALDYALSFLNWVNWHEIAEHKAQEYELFNDESEE